MFDLSSIAAPVAAPAVAGDPGRVLAGRVRRIERDVEVRNAGTVKELHA